MGDLRDQVDSLRTSIGRMAESEPVIAIGRGVARVGSTAQEWYDRARARMDSARPPARGDIALPPERNKARGKTRR